MTGCRAYVESRVRQSGVSVPRNSREAVIFDYYSALKEERYVDAYALLFWDNASSSIPSEQELKAFIELHRNDGHPLPTEISIGEETQAKKHRGEPCHYSYVVYAAYPDSLVLRSGQVYLIPSPSDPESCIIAYNSAFGF
ncbi:MAG: hypothetical protein AAGD25_19570 [Cyanobacteria bacterium P01_F01_bin.150]